MGAALRATVVAAVLCGAAVLAGTEAAGGAPAQVSGPTTISGPAARSAPDIAGSGAGHLVVWQQPGAGTGQDIFGRLLGGDGRPAGPGFPIADSVYDETDPAVAWNGQSYLVVWEFQFAATNTDVYARRVSADGVAGPDTYAASSGDHREESPDVTGAGTNFLIVWSDLRDPTEGWDIWARGAQPTGGRLDEFRVAGEETRLQLTEPAAAFNGAEVLVVWQRNFSTTTIGVFAQRTTLGIRVGNQYYLSSPTNARYETPKVASDGGGFLVVWAAGAAGAQDIRGVRIDPAGVALPEQPISTGAGDQRAPDVAHRGSYLVAWTDRRRSTGPDVDAARVTSAGAVSDPQGFPIASQPGPQDDPAVSAGAGWSLVHESGDDPATTVVLWQISAK